MWSMKIMDLAYEHNKRIERQKCYHMWLMEI